ncbi:HNH endonuclease signature motif containing protein [Nocardioides sp. SYSU D00038]|uniref:HNH endonuclease signature motif containing protein n=1 Tax=Nocardioides sp. SYSU D00038 TaxID=2812554 RepID=UPI001966FD16|nr:HNH endonuclease signature motif containing protein [Nocardioides sp. SYSU D00038]
MAASHAEPFDTADAVLDRLRRNRTEIARLEADNLAWACAWGDLHPGEALLDTVPGSEQPARLGGHGCPEVAEFCVAELGVALGISTPAARSYLAEALELRHRLPRLWHRVQAGHTVAWKARLVARQTMTLPKAGAAYVDHRLESKATRLGPRQIEVLVNEAMLRFDPAQAEADRVKAAEQRHVTITHGANGIAYVDAIVDTAVAIDLEAALAAAAAKIDTDQPLDVRRSIALGHLAQSDAGREIVIHVHDQQVGHLDDTGQPLLVTQVEQWCREAGTTVTVKPVIDLNQHLQTDSYHPTELLQRQTQLKIQHCAAPWCTRPARRCDTDHTLPYEQGGTTCSGNLVPLCRWHHRMKTHTRWTYHRIGPTTFLWKTPHNGWVVVDHTGTWEP